MILYQVSLAHMSDDTAPRVTCLKAGSYFGHAMIAYILLQAANAILNANANANDLINSKSHLRHKRFHCFVINIVCEAQASREKQRLLNSHSRRMDVKLNTQINVLQAAGQCICKTSGIL